MRTAIRVVLGGVLGGVTVFFWGFIAHTFTPLGTIGFKSVPQEEVLREQFKTTFGESGWYLFPAPDFDDPMNAEKSKAYMEKAKKGPSGILIIHPEGIPLDMPKQLGFELASNIAAALIASLLLSSTTLSFGGRVLFVASLGLFGWFSVCASQWTWYAFPTDFTFAALVDEVGGFLVAGIVLGLIFRPVPTKLEA